MSSSVYIPATSSNIGMSGPPDNFSIKTSSYTVPVGKYAVVKNLHGDLTIDGIAHYTIISSFSRSFAANNNATDFIYPSERIDFVKCTSTSTISSSSNITKCSFGMLSSYVNVDSFVSLTTSASGGGTGFFYSNISFTGTREVYLFSQNYNSLVPYNNASTPSNFSTTNSTFFGLGFYTQRGSGTVTHNVIACNFSKDNFLVPSGTVLSGVRYSVNEYTT